MDLSLRKVVIEYLIGRKDWEFVNRVSETDCKELPILMSLLLLYLLISIERMNCSRVCLHFRTL